MHSKKTTAKYFCLACCTLKLPCDTSAGLHFSLFFTLHKQQISSFPLALVFLHTSKFLQCFAGINLRFNLHFIFLQIEFTYPNMRAISFFQCYPMEFIRYLLLQMLNLFLCCQCQQLLQALCKDVRDIKVYFAFAVPCFLPKCT